MNLEAKLNPIHFVNLGHEKDRGIYSAEERAMFNSIRECYPELNEWGDMAIGTAWGSYSQDVHLLSWLEVSQTELTRSGLLDFVAYIVWHEVKEVPEWGMTQQDLLDFATEQGLSE